MKKRLMNNFSLKILSFLLAVFMWFLVVNMDDPVSERTFSNIGVQVLNEEIVLDNNRTYQVLEGSNTVSVTVTARRSILNQIRAEQIEAVADMKELLLGSQIPIQVRISGQEGRYEKATVLPRNLQVRIEDETRNNFPITPAVSGTVRDGYTIGHLKSDPEKITIRGPKTVVDRIARVSAEVDVSGLSENAKLPAKMVIYDKENNVVDQTLLTNNLGKKGIGVEVELYSVKSVGISVDKSKIHAKEGYHIGKVSPEPKEILVIGEKEVLDKVSEIKVPADGIRLEDLTERVEEQIDITQYLPNGVQLLDENTRNIVVNIWVGQEGVQIFDLSLNSLVVNNLASDLEINFGNAVDLEFQIKGEDKILKNFTMAKKASVDLRKYREPGTYQIPVLVELPEGCVLVNEVTIEVILEKK